MERGETCPPALALSTRLGGPYAEAHQASWAFSIGTWWSLLERALQFPKLGPVTSFFT